jgi:CheY-like chemotaxis protein
MIGDTVGVFQDKYNGDELLLKIQRDGNTIDNWLSKGNMLVALITIRLWSNIDTKQITSYDGSDDDNSTSAYSKKLANIILIDDEQDVLYSFKTVLSAQGYYVKTFAQSKEALKHLVELKNPFSFYDLVIVDIRMPDINGIQFYQILKIMNKNTKVLFISALDAAEETVSLFPEIMPDSIMRKSISKTYLLDKVNEIITHRYILHLD